MEASERMKKYFARIDSDVKQAFSLAEKARKKNYDPADFVEVKLAKNLAERVVGLISIVAPQIVGSGVVERIMELEKKWSPLDWRVAMQIALEVAQEKFCKFKDQKEAVEVGIRVGFAYVTLGVVSSPIEGFTSIDFKDRLDGKGKYFCMNFAGPIRNAGGTMAALSVIIADYVRTHLGFATYDPTEKEILRCHAELEDYHEYVTNLQYYPSKEESEFLMRHLPIEIGGDASEKYEVSNANLKDLPRIKENRLRSGYCLIHSSCIPLKAPKLWKNLSKWGSEMGLDHWNFLGEFVELQKRIRAKGADKSSGSDAKIMPDYNYIKDLVAGRPVFSHPLRSGGFRLRYGRSRTSGYSAMSIHPATMEIAGNFIATATHIKLERPSKGAAISSCDTIEGPVVKLSDGSVVKVKSREQAKKLKNSVEEILYIGDLLASYGDFLDRAHPLVPAGYCPEYWLAELEENPDNISLLRSLFGDSWVDSLLKDPLRVVPDYSRAKIIAEKTSTPLHPEFTFFYSQVSKAQLLSLLSSVKSFSDNKLLVVNNPDAKRCLELLGVEHRLVDGLVVVEGDSASALVDSLQLLSPDKLSSLLSSPDVPDDVDGLELLSLINKVSPFVIRDKAGTFIGARMGRPEKAKMRKLTGSPHGLFPVGSEGGRLRSIQSALEVGYVTADFSVYFCEHCNKETIYPRCHVCDSLTTRMGVAKDGRLVPFGSEGSSPSKHFRLNIVEYVDSVKKKLKTKIIPDLIKGVRGTSNKEHNPEHLVKAFLRAKHDIAVNKDGTTRYDASEVTMTHFKPKEIGTSVERLRELGYTHDIDGNPLERDDQVLEMFCQDLVVPACPESPDEGADTVLLRTAQFIDELLVKLYGLKPYYNAKTPQDLVGHYVIGLAPHTSAGMVGRIIGFSKTQAYFAHPLFHAAMRRDCDGDESCLLLVMDAFLNFSRKYLPESRGSTMDAPLVLTTVLDPAEVDDMAFHVDVPRRYPLGLYRAAEQYKMPWEVDVPVVESRLESPEQYEGYGFTHDTSDINDSVLCSAYKLLPSMEDKLKAQMRLAEQLRSVDENDVARLVIEKHFIRDTKGNLRKFSLQQFRCVNCNEKFRRPPLQGRCPHCGGKIIFTISEGSVIKYLEPSLSLARNYDVGSYLTETLELTKIRIESYFGKDKEKQTGLGEWFG